MRRSVKLYCMDRTERKSCNIFIIFKQETACEMRISDWSSDVCSSDLRGPGAGNAVSHRRRRRRTRHPAAFFELARPAGLEPATTRDRKSAVLVKSVSVRVDFSGRRNIKNKTYPHRTSHDNLRRLQFISVLILRVNRLPPIIYKL